MMRFGLALLPLLLVAAAPQRMPVVPPPPIGDCFAPGPFIVFFDRNEAVLSGGARAVLDNFVRAQADACGGFRFTITGHADRGEHSGIDRRRAAAVRALIGKRGLARLVASVRGVGSSMPRIARSAGGEELQNRRVELHVALGD